MIVLKRLGLVSYEEAWKLQQDLINQRAEGLIPDTLLLVEHPPVFTFGRKTPGVREESPMPPEIGGISVFTVERGGEATYHGPGQAVLYPIFQLDLLKTGPRAFLRMMEDAIACTLAKLGIYAYWLEGKTGVWVKDKAGAEKKIASLGIAVRKGVSYHGLALNVNNDLAPFRMISPCGFAPDIMTSVKELLGREVNFGEIQGELARELTVRFEDLKR